MAGPIAPYASVHISPKGPGDSRPTALQIIKDENLINKWANKTVLITGGSSGIGVETARALHATGARIFITTRDMAKAEAVVRNILETSPSTTPIEIIHMELSSLESVRAGAEDFLKRSDRLNVLVNNAGMVRKINANIVCSICLLPLRVRSILMNNNLPRRPVHHHINLEETRQVQLNYSLS
jgi:hypothetical protein